MPNGDVRPPEGDFQPILGVNTGSGGVPFSLAESSFDIYAGSRMARYVILSAEVTVLSSMGGLKSEMQLSRGSK